MNDKILLVDDERRVLDALTRRLRKKFDIHTASSGPTALSMISNEGPFAIVVSDMRMPELDGMELLIKIKETAPQTIRIMLTGNSDQETAVRAVNCGQIYQFLKKPVEEGVLESVLSDGLQEYRSAKQKFKKIENAEMQLGELSQQLNHQNSHDRLTGLLNREALIEAITALCDEPHGSDSTLLYISIEPVNFIDIQSGSDGKKTLLIQIADLLGQHHRETDLLAKVAEEDFAIFLKNCSTVDGMVASEIILDAIREFQFYWKRQRYFIDAWIGFAAMAPNETAKSLLSKGELACRVARGKSESRVQKYQDDDIDVARYNNEAHILRTIYTALEHNNLELYYQTIMHRDERRSKNSCYEILLRMNNADGDNLSPGIFFPVAEKFNLSTRLDLWVVETSLQWLATNPGHLEALERCSINLSGPSLANPSIINCIIDKIAELQIPAEKLCFEVTETAVIENLSEAITNISKLRSLGCQIALDDFGTGLSSFAYIQQIPADILKIDGTFIKNLDTSHINAAIVKCINDLAHYLGMKTVAEFVENDSIKEKLSELGIDYMQGYGVAKPQSIQLLAIETNESLASIT